MTEEAVYKKIHEAGWAVKVISILICALGLLLSVVILLGILNTGKFDSTDLISLPFLLVGATLFYYARKLEKNKQSIKTAKIYLIVFTVLFIPFITGLIGLFAIWYIGAALIAIHNFNSKNI